MNDGELKKRKMTDSLLVFRLLMNPQEKEIQISTAESTHKKPSITVPSPHIQSVSLVFFHLLKVSRVNSNVISFKFI